MRPQAEAQALRNSTTDSTKMLTEKLELTRELSILKPELDHLRSQVSANQQILAEKLALQRQVSEFQVELEHSKSEAKRAMAKRRNTQHDLAQEDTIDDLRKALTREKRLREKAEEAAETAQTDLEREKKSAQRKYAKEAKKAEQDAQVDVETEELRREIAQLQKERERAEKTFTKSQSDWDATKAILDDKLNQFRTKLKSTKEQLRESEAQLAEAQAAAVAAPKQSTKTATTTKQPKKRSAAQMDPDSQKLGTPGNDKPAKRGRKVAATAVGDKSTFSITPFLNRTMSIGGAPDSPTSDAEANESEVEASPTAAALPTKKAKPVPLKEQPASKTNIKKATQPRKPKSAAKAALEKVVEEPEPASQEAAPTKTTTSKVPLKTGEEEEEQPIARKQKAKMRKSLATFAAFNLEPEPEKKQKKRKLGGLGKTLFDEEDDVATKPLPGGRTAGLFGNTKLGPLAGGIKGSFLGGSKGLLGAKKPGQALLETGDGFMFSPLKRDRKVGASFLK